MPVPDGEVHRVLYVDEVYLKLSWGGSYENVAVPVAIGVNSAGDRESSAAPRDTPSPRSPGASSSSGSGGAGSPACGPTPATSARGCSVRPRGCSPEPVTGAARCISAATCLEGLPQPGERPRRVC